jgi:prepilin-type N-terminal cleavage/methylation domain-containing protein
MTCHASRTARDRGFTLIELVVVIAMVGLISTVTSAAIVTILRNEAATVQRLDDTRDLMQLAIWLPQDVNSTPTGTVAGTGIETGNLPSGCASPHPGTGLLRLTWTEKPTSAPAVTYRVNYRAEITGSSVVVRRHECVNFGPARVGNASRLLPLMPDGSLPVSVAASGSHVVFSVTQQPGTPRQTVVKIEADSRNPAQAALPEPPPPPPPPTMSLSVTTIDAGATLTAQLGRFQPNEPVSFYVDYTYSSDTSAGAIATVTADSAGAATAALTIPLFTTNGTHTVFAVGDDSSFASAALTVRNGTLLISNGTDSSVRAGGTITATLAGFTVGEVITLLMDDNTVLASLTYGNNARSRKIDITIPLKTTAGFHLVTAKSTSGRRAVSEPPLEVRPWLSLSPTSVAESFSTSAVLYGFRAGETVTYRLDSPSGPIIGTATADETGSANSSVTIPPFTAAGTREIHAVGDDISATSAPVTVTTALREFAITTSTPTVTAGGTATLRLQAMINGIADATLNGPAAIAVSGNVPSPDGTTPASPPSNITFVNGVATVDVNVVNAAPTTLIVTDSLRTGSSPPITVRSAGVASISFAVVCPNPIGQKWTSGVLALDRFGNAVANASVNVTFSPAVGTAGSIRSLDWTGWSTVTADSSYSSLTDVSGNTPSFTASGPSGNVSKPPTTVTATSSSASTTCTVSS